MEKSIAGMIFVFTGEIPGVKRSEARKILTDRGALVTQDMSPRVECLILGDNPGTRLVKAHYLDLPILTWAEFLEFYGLIEEDLK